MAVAHCNFSSWSQLESRTFRRSARKSAISTTVRKIRPHQIAVETLNLSERQPSTFRRRNERAPRACGRRERYITLFRGPASCSHREFAGPRQKTFRRQADIDSTRSGQSTSVSSQKPHSGPLGTRRGGTGAVIFCMNSVRRAAKASSTLSAGMFI